MPRVTQISEQKRRPNRRNVYLDGIFAFGCNLNVIARFRLREGMDLSDEQVLDILQGEVRQECFDRAMKYLQLRLHSRAELVQKLNRREYGAQVVESVADKLIELGYLDDARFARSRAQAASQHKHHGRRRARIALMKAGVQGAVADAALDEVYNSADSTSVARKLAEKQGARLRKLDPKVARRRLTGMLMRRGFDYQTIKPVVDELLGRAAEPDDFS